MTTTTYGDYSQTLIKKVICQRCRNPIKPFSLQQLLDHDKDEPLLCNDCKTGVVKKKAVKKRKKTKFK